MVGSRINLGSGRKVRAPGVTARQAYEQDPQRAVDRAWFDVVRTSMRHAHRLDLHQFDPPVANDLRVAVMALESARNQVSS